MPVVNLSFIRGKGTGGTGSGILADQLQILENDLGRDGFLSPGDYDILISKARDLQNSGSLTADQRSGYGVKISGYETKKAVNNLQTNEDLTSMEAKDKSDKYELTMVKGGNPAKYLNTKSAMLKNRLDELAVIIDRRARAGDNVIEHQAAYYDTLQQYRNISEADKAAGSYMDWYLGEQTKKQADPNYQIPATQPVIDGYAAYVVTNNKGEITDVDYGVYEPKSGYVETNGILGGFRVLAKPNYKQGGENVFKLGQDTYMAPDYDPTTMKPGKLTAGARNVLGSVQADSTADLFYAPDSVTTQIGISNGGYARGSNGSYYRKNGPSDYTKYINFNPANHEISENDILNIPKTIEDSIMPFAKETIDDSARMVPDEGLNMADPGSIESAYPLAPENPYSQSNAQIPGQEMSTRSNPTPSAENFNKQSTQARRTPQQPSNAAPAPTDFVSVAKRTMSSAADYVKNIFS